MTILYGWDADEYPINQAVCVQLPTPSHFFLKSGCFFITPPLRDKTV